MAIFAVVMLGIAATLGTGLAMTRTNRHRSVAANLASQEMDTIRSLPFASVVATSGTFMVDTIPYTISREVTWVAKSATTGPCDGSGTPQVLRVRVSVSWPSMRGVKPVVSDTTLTPPVGAYDPNTGHVGVKVTDVDGQPQFLVPVTLTGPNNRSGTTNVDGCAFFAFLPAGTYTASLGSSGWVDSQSNASPSVTKPVTVGNITSMPFEYEQAANLALTLTSPGAYPIPNDLPITVANPHLTNGQKKYPGTGTARVIGSLFPWLDGYDTWAGECADSDPEGAIKGTDAGGHPVTLGPYWPDAARTETLAVEGGQSTAAVVPLGDLDIQVNNAGALPHVGVAVVATHAADNICGLGEFHAAGTTDAAGHVRVALPYGTWKISVTGHTAIGSWPDAVVDPRAVVAASVVVAAT